MRIVVDIIAVGRTYTSFIGFHDIFVVTSYAPKFSGDRYGVIGAFLDANSLNTTTTINITTWKRIGIYIKQKSI